LKEKKFSIIPTVFLAPNTTKKNIKDGLEEIKPNEHLVLKRGIGEVMNCVFKIEMSKE